MSFFKKLFGGSKQQPQKPPETQKPKEKTEAYRFKAFSDKYESLEMVQDGLRRAGLESSNLIVGIDFTISNTDSGKRTFGGLSLHHIDATGATLNPYQRVIGALGRTLEVFDDDKLIPAFGFGDSATQDKSVFSLCERLGGASDAVCAGFEQVLQCYERVLQSGIKMAGPTSFAPVIRRAIDIVRRERAYHILVIVADGQVTPDSEYCHATSETTAAIVEASKYPLSIVFVGVGDGPWEQMDEFDDGLPQRKFDNFQFVEFYKHWDCEPGTVERKDTSFAVAALQEIPEQFAAIRQLGYI